MSGSFVNLKSEDTHCRLDGVYPQADRVQVSLRALVSGVTRWVNPVLSFVNLAEGACLNRNRLPLHGAASAPRRTQRAGLPEVDRRKAGSAPSQKL